ncbi:MAG: hypothetical protein V3T43_06120 [Nitrosomonadaceae bacterium]
MVGLKKRKTFLQGADRASANDITLGVEDLYEITGSVEMHTVADRANGEFTLHFIAAPLVKHNESGAGLSFSLANSGDFQAAAGDRMKFHKRDDTVWEEISRAIASGA